MQRHRCRIIDKRQCIRATATDNSILPSAGTIEQITTRTTGEAVITHTASHRVAVCRANNFRNIAQRIRRIARRRPRRQIDNGGRGCIGKAQRIRTRTTIDRITSGGRIN